MGEKVKEGFEMENKMKFYLYILFELAKYRKTTSSKNIENGDINIGSMDLVQNFIALICMDGEYLLDEYIEDKWALFVPSIRSSLSYLSNIGFVKIQRKKGEEELSFLKEPYDSFKRDQTWFTKDANIEKRGDRIEKLIQNLYPVNGENKDKKDEKIKLTVRVASCIWDSGRAYSEIDDNQLNSCFKTVRKVFGVRWQNPIKHEERLGKVFESGKNVVVRRDNKVCLAIKPVRM